MCVFPCWLLQHHQHQVMYYFLSLPSCFLCCGHCFSLLHSRMTSTTYCFIFSAIRIHTYMIPLFLWDLAYHGFMYFAIVSIKMCLSINGINKSVGEIQNSTKVDMAVGCSTEGFTIFFVVLVQTLGTVASSFMSSVCYYGWWCIDGTTFFVGHSVSLSFKSY